MAKFGMNMTAHSADPLPFPWQEYPATQIAHHGAGVSVWRYHLRNKNVIAGLPILTDQLPLGGQQGVTNG
ncbi:hypothetical protein BFW41_15435 [Aeromonas hydrophila]|nr:hypothetical protein BFW41_15435 [Aeromonas hydrophila]